MSNKKKESARFKIYEKDPAKTRQMEKKRWNMNWMKLKMAKKNPKAHE